ncbi:MAG: DUF4304 domain-containing protein [Rhodocyclaceae bacterium]
MSNAIVSSVVSAVAPIFEQEGFSKNAEGFFRVRPQFADYLSIQVKSDNTAIALNAGIQPIFLLSAEQKSESALRGGSEVDCYVRARLAPDGQADYWIPLALEPQGLAEEIAATFKAHGKPFFEFFASSESLSGALTIEGIQSGNLPAYFSMMTKSRLALLGAKANLSANNTALARAFAEYGLSVAGMAVSLKREFKNIIAGT